MTQGNLRDIIIVTNDKCIYGLIGFNKKFQGTITQGNINKTPLMNILNNSVASFVFNNQDPIFAAKHLYLMGTQQYNLFSSQESREKETIVNLDDILFLLDPHIQEEIKSDPYAKQQHEQQKGNMPHDVRRFMYGEKLGLEGHVWDLKKKLKAKQQPKNRFIAIHSVNQFLIQTKQATEFATQFLDPNYLEQRNFALINARTLSQEPIQLKETKYDL